MGSLLNHFKQRKFRNHKYITWEAFGVGLIRMQEMGYEKNK